MAVVRGHGVMPVVRGHGVMAVVRGRGVMPVVRGPGVREEERWRRGLMDMEARGRGRGVNDGLLVGRGVGGPGGRTPAAAGPRSQEALPTG